MSQIKVNSIVDASGGNTATINTYTPTESNMPGYNRIINGNMRIDQRNAGAAVTVNTAGNFYAVDRFNASGQVTDGVFTVQRSSTAPAGFTNSMIATVTTADASIGASQQYLVGQIIEGFNIADLGWGTASAATITLSFWVRSSLTGTFGGTLVNVGFNRSYPFTYTISAANTFELKTVTIAGDTTGTWATDNTAGIRLQFSLGAGSTYSGTAGVWAGSYLAGATGQTQVIGTNGATFYITGVQLEVGSVATPFERRDYGRELAMCQRYYYRTTPTSVGRIAMAASAVTNSTGRAVIPFPVTMRAAPSALEQSGTAGDYSIFFLTTATACTSVPTFSTGTVQAAEIVWTATAGHTAGNAGTFYSTGTAGYLAWSAEL